MARLRRRILTFIALLLITLSTTLIVVILTLNLDRYRPQLEQGLSRALGVEFKIAGRLRLSLQPELALSLDDVTLNDAKIELIKVKKMNISFALLPLLNNELQLKRIELQHAKLALDYGSWPLLSSKQDQPVAGTDKATGLQWKLAENSIYTISHSHLSYGNKNSPWFTEINGLNLHLKAEELDPVKWNNMGLSALGLQGTLRADGIKTKLSDFEHVRMQVAFSRQTLKLTDISSQLFQGDGHGDFSLDFSNTAPDYHLNFKLQDLEASESISRLARQGLISGPLSLYADLQWQGKSAATMLGSLSGDAQLSGEGLSLKGIDLDKTITDFEKSQRFNLVDLGAYFFIGPMGTVATKGYSFARITTSNDEASSRIERMVSDWQLEKGIALAQDVALATKHNRIALRGRLDLIHGRYEGVEFAVLDKQGCAILSQKITGPLQNPVIETPKKLALVTAPLREALDIPLKLLGNNKCTPFYTGSLPNPETLQR